MTETQTQHTDWRTTGCPVCGSRSMSEFFTLRGVPSQDGVLWETPEEARCAPTGDIRLMLCAGCGYIGNELHDPAKVRFTGYDVSLQHSPLFCEFTRQLAERLIGRFGLHGRTILDIGCGKGDFLRTICRLGTNRGIGFDPSYQEADNQAEDAHTTFIRDYYSSRYADYAADLIVCRHVIDILGDPAGFLSMLRSNIGPDRMPLIYFESPDARYTITNRILWNIVYEHKSWFTPDSYRALFERSGFDVLAVSSCWNNEYLGIECVPSSRKAGHAPVRRLGSGASPISELGAACSRFGSDYEKTMKMWSARLEQFRMEGQKAALWGAGARGISFLNFFRAQDPVQTVIDINPARQGKYLPVSAQRVTAPECLMREAPDVIIISNPTYEREIRAQAAALGYQGQFLTL